MLNKHFDQRFPSRTDRCTATAAHVVNCTMQLRVIFARVQARFGVQSMNSGATCQSLEAASIPGGAGGSPHPLDNSLISNSRGYAALSR
jgi:hypothetical protein